jgi:hypothetical protein
MPCKLRLYTSSKVTKNDEKKVGRKGKKLESVDERSEDGSKRQEDQDSHPKKQKIVGC